MADFGELSVSMGIQVPFIETPDGNIIQGDINPFEDAAEPAAFYYSLAGTAEYNKGNLPDKATLAMNTAAFGQ